ncbi:MAG: hypothetical protein LBS69_01460 [Prevotellaceae bacterium]|jgi:hypothetical protein|nr:hypothetical protein [Prevotellaceae bacterium]
MNKKVLLIALLAVVTMFCVSAQKLKKGSIPEFSEKFVKTLNTVLSNKNRDLAFGDFQHATIQFLKIDDNGMKAFLIFSQNDSENSLAEISIDGDAMKNASKQFGKFLLKSK